MRFVSSPAYPFIAVNPEYKCYYSLGIFHVWNWIVCWMRMCVWVCAWESRGEIEGGGGEWKRERERKNFQWDFRCLTFYKPFNKFILKLEVEKLHQIEKEMEGRRKKGESGFNLTEKSGDSYPFHLVIIYFDQTLPELRALIKTNTLFISSNTPPIPQSGNRAMPLAQYSVY